MSLFSLISREIDELKLLLIEVESGHSFSIINYDFFIDEEVEILKEFDVEGIVGSLYPISEYEGHCENMTKEEAFDELRRYLTETFDFNVMFSRKEKEANRIKSDVYSRINNIINILRNTALKLAIFEIRIVDKGGYDLVRLDFKEEGKSMVFEFNYFID